MKKLFDKYFEQTWLVIFLIMFGLIMLPLPCFYNESYSPLVLGIPSYIFGWFAHTAVTFALIVIYYKMCMKRKEYHIYDQDENEEEKNP